MRRKDVSFAMKKSLAAVLLVCVLFCVSGCGTRVKTIEFKEHLDDTVLELDGRKIPLRELAFYVAYEEQLIQEQALVYDASNPNAYWNTHINGHFMRVQARDEAMNQAIHDFIFYEMAQELGIELDQDEEQLNLGDVDGSGSINLTDVLLIMRYYNGEDIKFVEKTQ